MLDITGADVALTNGGGIRASIEVGEITKGDVITVLPFGNFITTKEVSGADLKAALENGASAYPGVEGGVCPCRRHDLQDRCELPRPVTADTRLWSMGSRYNWIACTRWRRMISSQPAEMNMRCSSILRLQGRSGARCGVNGVYSKNWRSECCGGGRIQAASAAGSNPEGQPRPRRRQLKPNSRKGNNQGKCIS